MVADNGFMVDAQDKDSATARKVANLIVLYRACMKSKHPHSLEMARRYEQELRQLSGPATTGNASRTVVLSESVAY
jgi:hypothetical protein